ncbi:serine hydrolase [Carboxylicivirga linearis]|uniref:Serine hydrolase n=2 Tax=Carboxylicivirga linearis TaxID=1628157 RepID=A0ABS5JZG5_9BACT|nr:serine hydrolase [Carboxylicivirga linearis]
MKRYKIINIAMIMSLILMTISCSDSLNSNLKYSAPELKGYSSQKLDTLSDFLDKSGTSSMIILVDGDVIFEYGNTTKKHLIHSIRKCLLNSLIGIAVEQGKIDTSMTLKELNIQDIDTLSATEQNARIADLLKSKSGIYHPAAAMSQGMINSLPKRNSDKPGTYYYYNNWDFNTLGAILEEKTVESIYELFLKEIANPIGMSEYKGEYVVIDGDDENVEMPKVDGFYQYEKSKSKYPAYHFRMSTRDLALYGQLYLNNGKWNNKQIISESWIKSSTTPTSIYNEKYNLGYGMLWKLRLTDDKKDIVSFYHTGVGIHMLAIYPDYKMVLVHRVDTENDYDYEKNNIYKMLGLVMNSKIE